MRINVKHARILILILSSLVAPTFAIFGMYVTWNWTFVSERSVRSFMVLVVGIFCFAIGVLLFWRLVALEEAER